LALVLSTTFLHPRFGTIDEFFMSEIINGGYTGKSQGELVFIQPLIGELIKFIFDVTNFNNTYSIFMVQIIIISFVLLIETLKSKSIGQITKIITYLQLFFILITYVLQPTFTYASIILVVTNILTLVMIDYKSNKSLFIIANLLFISGLLIRQETVLIAILVLIILLVGIKIQRKKVDLFPLLFTFGIALTGLVVNKLIQVNQMSGQWDKFVSWNNMRHQIHNRKAQFKLNEILFPGGWRPEEHNLFVDWAYGDPNIFTIDWIKIAFDYTEDTRGLKAIFNLDINYLLFNFERYQVFQTYIWLFIAQILLLAIIWRNRGEKQSYWVLILPLVPSVLVLAYSSFFLLLPSRVLLPLLVSPVLISLYFTLGFLVKLKKIDLSLILVVFAIYVTFVNNLNIENKEKNENNFYLLNQLEYFNPNGIYLIPGCNNPNYSENPFTFKSKVRKVEVVNVGCWDTFSPHWVQKNNNLGLNSISIYSDLFKSNVYWLGSYVPNTSLNVENLMRLEGKNNFERNTVKELKNDHVIFKFIETKSYSVLVDSP